MRWKPLGKCKLNKSFLCKYHFSYTFKKNNSFSFSLPEEPDPEAKPRSPPVFVSKPESIQVEEGEWARFCVRVTGHPRPRVMWLINGHTVVNVSCSCKTKENYFLLDVLYLDGMFKKNVQLLLIGLTIQANIRWNVPFGYTKN